jgi:hypothetical protein
VTILFRPMFIMTIGIAALSCSSKDSPDSPDTPNQQITGSWAVVAAEGDEFEGSGRLFLLPEIHFSEDGTFFILESVGTENDSCEVQGNDYNCESYETEEGSLDPGISCRVYASCGTYTIEPVSGDSVSGDPQATHLLTLDLDRANSDAGWTTVTLRWALSFGQSTAFAPGPRPLGSRQMTVTPQKLEMGDLEAFTRGHWVHLCHDSQCTKTYRQISAPCSKDTLVYWEASGDFGEVRPLENADHVSHCL